MLDYKIYNVNDTIDSSRHFPIKDFGKNPLHFSANAEIALLLIDNGVNINLMANGGYTPLHEASRRSRLDVVTTLIRSGCHIDSVTDSGCSALHFASCNGYGTVISALLESGCQKDLQNSLGQTALHVVDDKETVVSILIHAGCNMELRDRRGLTPLLKASSLGERCTVKTLLAFGCDKDACKRVGHDTVMHLAKTVEVMELLFSAGCEKDARNSLRRTPLHEAADHQNYATAKFLLDIGCDTNSKCVDGQTPFHYSIPTPRSTIDISEMLIAKGANIYEIDKNGESCLHVAAMRCNINCVQFLVDQGANVLLENIYGEIALDLCGMFYGSVRSSTTRVYLMDVMEHLKNPGFKRARMDSGEGSED